MCCKQLAIAGLFVLAASQLALAPAPSSVGTRLAAQNALFDESWQAALKMSPLLATSVPI